MRAVILLFAFAGIPAFAQETIYVGVGIGSLDYQESTGHPVLRDLTDTTSINKLYGGFEFSENFTLEINYAKTDDIRETRSGNSPTAGDFTLIFETDFTMTALKAVGQVPFDWGVLLGGLGYFSSQSDITFIEMTECCSGRNAGSISDDGLMASLGIEWRFGRFGTGYGVRLEYEWWDVADVDLSAIGLGVAYRF